MEYVRIFVGKKQIYQITIKHYVKRYVQTKLVTIKQKYRILKLSLLIV